VKVATEEDTTLQPILAFFKKNSNWIPIDIRYWLQEYMFIDGILCFKDMIYVPNDEELQRQILRSKHDAPIARHQGRIKTLNLVIRIFYWPTVRRYVHHYINGCNLCQQSKSIHHP